MSLSCLKMLCPDLAPYIFAVYGSSWNLAFNLFLIVVASPRRAAARLRRRTCSMWTCAKTGDLFELLRRLISLNPPAAAEGGGAPAADMEEVDMDGVGDAWGNDDGLDMGGDVETPAIDNEDMQGLDGGEEGDEEGGWEMEVCADNCAAVDWRHA